MINETVKAARDFLKENPDEKDKLVRNAADKRKTHGRDITAVAIADFLDWPIKRIESSLASLHDLEQGHIDKDEYESFPHQESAETFRKEIKQNPIPKSDRLKIVEKIKRKEIGTKNIRQEILQAKFKNGKTKERRKIELDDHAFACFLTDSRSSGMFLQ